MHTSFVERVFEVPGGEVGARFDMPYLASGGEYRCRWRILWPDREQSSEIAGIDGVQALLLAMRNLHATLVHSEEYRAGALTYLDQGDLDLPPSWGSGPLYDLGTRA